MKARQCWATVLLGAMLLCGTAQAALQPPKGYFGAVTALRPGSTNCPPIPAPFTQSLQFRSKYDGSNRARATLNPEAQADFSSATHSITQMERQTVQGVMHYLQNGRPAQLDCTLAGLITWAQADALMSQDFNHTGKSMRKWALASLASSYAQLKFSRSQPLASHRPDAAVIEAWLGRLATQVVSDWDGLPLARTNNHSYWAAWSVMASAVVLNRQDLFDWAVKQYRIGASQVDAQGYLPNELKRQQRALAYHNYAVAPLSMIASFALANGVDLRDEHQQALQCLGERVLAGASDPSGFEQHSGATQALDDLQKKDAWAWLEPWCNLYACSAAAQQRLHAGQPFNSSRLGGNLTRVYSP